MANSKDRRSGLANAGHEVGRLVDDAAASQQRIDRKRDRSWDAARTKATYDLPPELIERIKQIAAELKAEHGAKVRISDVAYLLLAAGLHQYEEGELEIELTPSEFTLKIG